jgi:hypothetical protein
MTVILPDWVSASAATPELVDAGLWNKGALSGPYTRTDRPGSRWAVKITLPPVWTDLRGAALIADLVAAKREGMEFKWPVGAFTSAPMGTPLVNGSSVQGTSLPLDGFYPNTVIRKGQFFSITHDGNSYLHQVREEVIASDTGEATLSIQPELRVILDDNDPCEFVQPVIQGVVLGERWSWQMRVDKFTELSFDLVEQH